MHTYEKNEQFFDEHGRTRQNWRESVEHVATGLHHRAQQLAGKNPAPLRVLDLGAGDTGLSSYPYLAKGCTVYAVDSSGESLQRLQLAARDLPGELVLRHEDIDNFITEAIQRGELFDIVVARSFLHHIPDYLGVLSSINKIIAPQGVFLSYEDPPRYDTMSGFDSAYSNLSYFSLRLFRGNYIRGIKTRWRRLFGRMDNNLPEDVVEYHIVRNGVDDEAIKQLFEDTGFTCEITKYFTTENLLSKHLGRKLNVKNSFAALAYRGKIGPEETLA